MKEIDPAEEEKLLRLIFGEKETSTIQGQGGKPDSESYARLKEKFVGVLGTLNEREKQVLELRFGLGDGYSRTLEEVGKQFKVTREHIRQIEAKALRKMRHPTRVKHLGEILGKNDAGQAPKP